MNKELLKYLVQVSLRGENPKEYQIAAEVFGRKIGEEKEINVRAYMLNLRKKLHEYYDREGRGDELIFELPKGEYQVRFRYSVPGIIRKKIDAASPWLFMFSVTLVIAAILLVRYNSSAYTRISLWKPLLAGKHPVLLVLGDHYFFRSRIATGKIATVRDNQVNSDADFEEFLSHNPTAEAGKSDLTYINNQAPIGLFHIMKILGGRPDIKMDYSSRLRMDEFRGQHVIFVGSFKTLKILAPAVEKMGLKYDIANSLLEYKTADSLLHFDNRSDGYLNYEYAGLIRFITNDGRNILFLLCDNDIGNIALVRYLTDPSRIKNFDKVIKNKKMMNFKSIFEVKGQYRTDFKIRLIRLDPLPENAAEIWP
ncbi:MAG: hypothetical protein ABFD10_16615 [Prolixibacteraceae bacterium]